MNKNTVHFVVCLFSIIASSYSFAEVAGALPKSPETLSRYSFYKAAERFSLTSVRPKIFCPDEADESVAKVCFTIDNPNFSEVSSTIYDINGNVVKVSLTEEGTELFSWDGRDSDNNVVSSGVYIYQLEADGKVVNGTVVVAR
ncbi:MAG: hypothetical protein A2314_08165 [Elusimicrobia bacterium RIFOXYB2_FULL_50_12]|nr:MAG: hypothetical protein A2314_08165 [Elusimicrobia bacterium RIFOXYB2_FULL_50_12]